MSDDGRSGLTIIFFVGSVFSPYYAWARRAGRADPDNHVAVNVALYGAGGYRWAMTERSGKRTTRGPNQFAIARSRIGINPDGTIDIEIEERCVPLPRRLSGRMRITPRCLGRDVFELDPDGRHIWQPIAPLARIVTEFDNPLRSWEGAAYVDHNRGAEPLEARFERWSWARTIERDQTRIFYDTVLRGGVRAHQHVVFDASGRSRDIAAPGMQQAGLTLWRIPIEARSDQGSPPLRKMSWEDGPFYARSLLESTIEGERVQSVHEAVSLERFRRPWVQCLLPFRMPRRSG